MLVSGRLSLLFGRPGCRIKIEFSLWLLRAVCAPNDPSSKDTWFNCGRFLLAGSKGRDKAMWLLHLCWRIPACRHFDMWPLTKFSTHIKKDLETVWMIVHVIQQVHSLILDPICVVLVDVGEWLPLPLVWLDKAMWLLHLCWRIPACRHFDMWPLTKFSTHIKKDLETVWMIVHVIQQVHSLILDPICGVGWCWWVAASSSCLVRPGCRIKIEFSLWLLRAICAPDDPSSKDTWFNCGRFLLDN